MDRTGRPPDLHRAEPIVTCQLHGINAYDYLVDVLQRIDRHPAARVDQLTPRLWKEHFAQQRLRSQIEQFAA